MRLQRTATLVLASLGLATTSVVAAQAASASVCTPGVPTVGVCANTDAHVYDEDPSAPGKDVTTAESVTVFAGSATPVCIGRVSAGYQIGGPYSGLFYYIDPTPYPCY
jgi:hypothetical protein